MISMFDEQFNICLSLGSLFLTRPISGLTCTVKLASSCEVSNLTLSIQLSKPCKLTHVYKYTYLHLH
ncbi:hypothetical protein EUTSA_v10017506mg [Eutrema salsugineum]|uniref:Uncharacterized protein n=1 Tax=Eutrema salsugineum TaxID=72664 RepID=V4LQC5_EUTSA|nr:hypothetical protein EUTSA_v10017506mg [Eutrema salsugineum]